MTGVARKPGIFALVAGALVWGVVMAASAWLGLWWREWETGDHIFRIVLLFFIGALVAYPLAIAAARWLAADWSSNRRFATAFLALAAATIGVTAGLYALQYRLYYSEWHDDHFSIRWGFELVFTTLAAIYQFAVMGMSLFLPLGFLALIVASYRFARRTN